MNTNNPEIRAAMREERGTVMAFGSKRTRYTALVLSRKK